MDRCFPARFDLFTDPEYFIEQYRWRPKYALYPFYSPYVSSAVFTTCREPVKAGLRKEMSNKNGAVITKKYTARDDVKLNTHRDLRIRVFVFYKWVFEHVFDPINCVITAICTLSVALVSRQVINSDQK